LWQVNGRSSLPFQQWMELDLQYVRNWSLWLDLQILAKTVPAVLRGSGAA
jgi:lipopolysaccharide/colanic/teichoic acid biosynthesis glycosyltransferase